MRHRSSPVDCSRVQQPAAFTPQQPIRLLFSRSRLLSPRRRKLHVSAAPLDGHRSSNGRRPALRWILACLQAARDLAIALVAIVMALVTWDYYVTAPWTRDGRVRVQVASVAPQVSGQITELQVGDNQYVHKGDVLYVIDPFDFEVALQRR